MSRFMFQTAAVALMGLGPAMAVSAATSVAIDPNVASTWSRFNFTDSFGADNNADRIRTNVFDAGGGRQVTMKFTGLSAAMATLGKTTADIDSAKLELTVRDFDVEFGAFGWTLYSVDDGVANEDFDAALDTFHDLPGILDGVSILASADPTETTAQDSLSLLLDSTVDPTFDDRPTAGQVMTFDISDLSVLTGDTNDVLVLHFHQTTGENSGFRPQWGLGTDTPGPRLILTPEPGSLALLGLGGLAVLRRRRA